MASKKLNHQDATSTGDANGSSLSAFVHSSPLKATDKKVSVGKDHQVSVIEFTGEEAPPCKDEFRDSDVCLWRPNFDVSEKSIREYCKEALESFNISLERALWMLFSSGYDLDEARKKLRRRRFFQNHFSLEDDFIFQNAFSCYGKDFQKIKQMMPKKSMRALVEYYYKTKKRQHYKNFYDADIIGDISENDEVGNQKMDGRIACENCKNFVKAVFSTNGINVCRTCRLSFKSLNTMPQWTSEKDMASSSNYFCPPEMESVANSFNELADEHMYYENADDAGELQIGHEKLSNCQLKSKELESEIDNLCSKVLQLESSIEEDSTALAQPPNVELIKKAKLFLSSTESDFKKQKIRFTLNWSRREEMAALQALVRFDSNPIIVSHILGTKTPDMVEAFCIKHTDFIKQKTNGLCGQLTTRENLQ